MVNLKKNCYLLGLFIFTTVSVTFVFKYAAITVNNRFVCGVIIACLNILALIFIFINKNNMLRNMLAAIVSMSAFAFLLVPLYNVFCDVTGLNGKLDLSLAAATSQGVDATRDVTVEFVVNQNREMPWQFSPKHSSLTLHPGQLATTAYFAKNTTNKTMYAQAIPSISPSRASKFFKKVECFCFTNQKLGPGETTYLGLRFYLDPALPKDIKRVTLAYTIFDITETK